MTDLERVRAARQFFWDMMREFNQEPVTVETAHRQIRKLAEALPPFTRVSPEVYP